MAKTKDTAAGPKKRNDAYTVMLFITLLALGIGCTLMYLDWDEYGQKSPPAEKVPPMPKLGTIPVQQAAPKAPEEPEKKPEEPEKKPEEPEKKDMEKKDTRRPGPAERAAADLPFLPVAFATTSPVAFAGRAPLPLPRLGPSELVGFDALPGVVPPAN